MNKYLYNKLFCFQLFSSLGEEREQLEDKLKQVKKGGYKNENLKDFTPLKYPKIKLGILCFLSVALCLSSVALCFSLNKLHSLINKNPPPKLYVL